jgi:hypothetical protein
MGEPGAAEALQRLKHDEALLPTLLGQVVGAAYPGDAGADDQDVEVFGVGGNLGGAHDRDLSLKFPATPSRARAAAALIPINILSMISHQR